MSKMSTVKVVHLLLLAFLCIAANGESLNSFYDPLAASFSSLQIRQDDGDGSDGSPCPVTFHCDARQNGANTRRDVFFNSSFTTGEVHKRFLTKRMLQDLQLSDIRSYTMAQLQQSADAGPDVYQDIVPEQGNNDLTGFVQQEFQNWVNNQNKLVIGVNPGFLEGCSMLAIISRRAVYMGHIWQNLGFGDPPDEGNPDSTDNPLLTNNVLNVLNGVQPQEDVVSTPAFDPNLFNRNDDNTVAYIMSPRDGGRTRRSLGNFYFPNAIEKIGTTIRDRIGQQNLKSYVPYGYYSLQAGTYPENEPWRGAAFFEYDPNADGKGNGDWRLIYEHTQITGVLGAKQEVIGVNDPTPP